MRPMTQHGNKQANGQKYGQHLEAPAAFLQKCKITNISNQQSKDTMFESSVYTCMTCIHTKFPLIDAPESISIWFSPPVELRDAGDRW